MSTWKLIRLNFGRSPVHFGELGIGMEECSERVRSDTLFSAWVSTYARLFKKKAVEQLLQPFPKYSNHGGNTASSIVPFRLSSTFVFKRERDRIIDYLPRSIELPRGYPIGNDLTFAKTFKKLNYLPLEVWQRWYQGSGFDKQDRSELELKEGDRPDKNGRLYRAVTFSYQDTFGGSQQPVPRVAIDRTTRATNFYHTGFIQYQWEFDPKDKQHINSLSGLYFLLNFPQANPDLEQKLEAALHLLGEEGLGGERSSGAGRFEVEWLELPKDWQDIIGFKQANSYSLISLFWELPLPDYLNHAPTTAPLSYVLQQRGGWIASPSSGRQLRRQSVNMFAEGSVFPVEPEGKLADVTPGNFDQTPHGHKVYRSGIALSLPIKVERSE